MSEVLASMLSGDRPSMLTGGGASHHYFAAYNISAFCDLDEFKQNMDDMLRMLQDTPPAPGHARVLYPGLSEYEEEQERPRERHSRSTKRSSSGSATSAPNCNCRRCERWTESHVQMSESTHSPDDKLFAEIEARAVELARGGGELLSGYFGGNLSIQYKDDNQRDPVTDADRETQDFLTKGILESFPDHDILGEEDDENAQDADAAAGDFLWVLDPLDGTKNFLHGLPVYACSVGVLYRGEPSWARYIPPGPRKAAAWFITPGEAAARSPTERPSARSSWIRPRPIS